MSKAVFITTQRVVFGIPYAVSCRALGVSQAWYYKWRGGGENARAARRRVMDALVAYLFGKHHGTYGSPRITDDLRAMGWRVSKNTVAKSMAAQGLVDDSVARRGQRQRTSHDDTGQRAVLDQVQVRPGKARRVEGARG